MIKINDKEVKFLVIGSGCKVKTTNPITAFDFSVSRGLTTTVIIGSNAYEANVEQITAVASAVEKRDETALIMALKNVAKGGK